MTQGARLIRMDGRGNRLRTVSYGALSSIASSHLSKAAQAGTGSAITRGIAVATGIHADFSWSGGAAAAVGAGFGSAVGAAVGSYSVGDLVGGIPGQSRRLGAEALPRSSARSWRPASRSAALCLGGD